MSFSTYTFSNGRPSLSRTHSLWIGVGDTISTRSQKSQRHFAPPAAPSPRRSGHLELEVPEEYEDRLSLDPEDGEPLWRLILVGTTAGLPFLTELYSRHQVKSKIIKVWLEYDENGAQYGQVLVQLFGETAQSSQTEAFFEEHGILLELVGYLKTPSS